MTRKKQKEKIRDYLAGLLKDNDFSVSKIVHVKETLDEATGWIVSTPVFGTITATFDDIKISYELRVEDAELSV